MHTGLFKSDLPKAQKISDNRQFKVIKVRKADFLNEDDICIEWIDGTDWWWGQIGSSQPWTDMFFSEKEFNRNKNLEILFDTTR